MNKFKWEKVLICMMIMMLHISAIAYSEIATEYTLGKPGFEQTPNWGASNDWGRYPDDDGYISTSDTEKHGGAYSLKLTTTASSTHCAIWQVIDVGSNGVSIADIVEAEVWVYIDPLMDFDAGNSYLAVESAKAGRDNILIARSADLSELLPTGGWVKINTFPYHNGGKILEGEENLVIAFKQWEIGTLYIDDIRAGKRRNSKEYPLINKSFEQSTLLGWGSCGAVSVYTSKSYYGAQSVKMEASIGGFSAMWASLQVNGGQDNSPMANEKVEAGVWVYFDIDLNNIASNDFYIKVESESAGGTRTEIARSTDIADMSISNGRWIYFKTEPVRDGAVLSNAVFVTVSIQNYLDGTVYVDFYQVGEVNVINGNPVKFALAEHQPWYGNKDDGWYNWGLFGHDPSQIIEGKPDTASAYHPTIGAYDSLDPAVIEWQIDIAKAMLIDGFMVDYYADFNPRYKNVFETLVTKAENNDMKICILYEPKIHYSDWGDPDLTSAQRLYAVKNDLKYVIDQWGGRKGYLKYKGKPVIGIFDMDAAYYVNDERREITPQDWANLKNDLTTEGYDFHLMGDAAPNEYYSDIAQWYPSFNGMFNWNIVHDSLLEQSNPTDEIVYNWVRDINNHTKLFSYADDEERLGISLIWPGFDDSGVNGWGSGIIRKEPFDLGSGVCFYDKATEAVMDNITNWVMIATMNDWNESTIIEPSLENGYLYSIKTQNFLEQYKEAAAVPDSDMEIITHAYLSSLTNPPQATSLIAPVNGITIPETNPVFKWQGTTNTTQYKLIVKNSLEQIVIEEHKAAKDFGPRYGVSFYVSTSGLAEDDYTWTVQTFNDHGGGPISSGSFSISLPTPAPGVAALILLLLDKDISDSNALCGDITQ